MHVNACMPVGTSDFRHFQPRDPGLSSGRPSVYYNRNKERQETSNSSNLFGNYLGYRQGESVP